MIRIAKKLTGEVYILSESSGLLIKELTERVFISLSHKSKGGGIYVIDDRGSKYELRTSDVRSVQIEPASPIIFDGTTKELFDLLVNVFFDSIYISSSTTNLFDTGNWVFVKDASDLPAPIGGIHELEQCTTYIIAGDIDLLGNRILAKEGSSLIGGSSISSKVTSTGLVSDPLITTEKSLQIQDITLYNCDVAIKLDAINIYGERINFEKVVFLNCTESIIARDYSFVFIQNCRFDGQFTIDGDVDNCSINNSYFKPISGLYGVNVLPSCNIANRIKLSSCNFDVQAGAYGLNIDETNLILKESYLLDFIEFKGAGTYLSGITHTSFYAVFNKCTGITNTWSICQYYSSNNTLVTTINTVGVFEKININTIAGLFIQKFSHSNNRATYEGEYNGYFKATCTLSLNVINGNNNDIELRLAVNGSLTNSSAIITADAAGNAKNITINDVVFLSNSDYLEVFITNLTAQKDIILTTLSIILERIN